MTQTLGTHLRTITGCVAVADSLLTTFYGGIAFVAPDKGLSQLQQLDVTLAQLEMAAAEMRGRVASILEDRNGT